MSVAPRYLGEFVATNSGTLVVMRPDPSSDYVQYRCNGSRLWHRMRASEWCSQVDNGSWVSAIPEELRVSEGL